MALTISISLSTKKQGLFFTFIAYTKSKGKFSKPYSRIAQFFKGLHYQAHKSAGQSLLRGV
jgi:hypothetical protein